MTISFEIPGKIAVITGGGSGLGLSFAQLLYSKGAKAVVIGDIALTQSAQEFIDKAQEAKTSDESACGVYFTKCDVTKWDELEALLIFAESQCGGQAPDIYLPSAGIAEMGQNNFWLNLDSSHPFKLFEINIHHPIKFAQMAISRLSRAGKPGVILMLASVAGLSEALIAPLYTASKWAIVGFSRSMTSLKNSSSGIRVVCVCPGPVITPIWPVDVAAGLPKKAWITPQTCAEHMLDLVQNHASGTVMRVDDLGGVVVPLYGSIEPQYEWSFTGSRERMILGLLDKNLEKASGGNI